MQSMFCTKGFYFIFVYQMIKKYLIYEDMQNLQDLSLSLCDASGTSCNFRATFKGSPMYNTIQ